MPDQFRFDKIGGLLGEGPARYSCIDCGEGGPAYEWPESRREEHFASHRPERDTAAAVDRARESAARLERKHAERIWLEAHRPRKCRGCHRTFSPKRSDQVYHEPGCGDRARYLGLDR